MLRPAKLFHSLHQLRHYVQTKVTELVVQHPLPPFLLQSTTPTSAAITPFAQRTYQPKPLANGLQHQFPMINKACSPIARGVNAAWLPASSFTRYSSWHRGINLTRTSNIGYHNLGCYRSYSSSTVTPFFQSTLSSSSSASSCSRGASVFSYISSGIFAPVKQQDRKLTPTVQPRQNVQQQPSSSLLYRSDEQQKPLTENNRREMSHALKTTPPDNTVTSSSICRNDDMVTLHSTTVPSPQTYFYITMELFPSINNAMFKDEISSTQSTLSVSTSSTWKPWTRDTWPLLVTWKERQQQYYDRLLLWLQPCLDKGYHLQMVGSSLRVYFPKQVKQRHQALECLHALKRIVQAADTSQSPTHIYPDWELQEQTVIVDEPLIPLGPDYFQGIELFLTHIDNLVDHGPAFAKIGTT